MSLRGSMPLYAFFIIFSRTFRQTRNSQAALAYDDHLQIN
jgi:hypothetical protein